MFSDLQIATTGKLGKRETSSWSKQGSKTSDLVMKVSGICKKVTFTFCKDNSNGEGDLSKQEEERRKLVCLLIFYNKHGLYRLLKF